VIQLIPFYLKFIKNHLKAKKDGGKASSSTESDFDYFKLYYPSVQPTSDMYWAGDRLGKIVLKHMLIKNTKKRVYFGN
jgi:hypothetical protein